MKIGRRVQLRREEVTGSRVHKEERERRYEGGRKEGAFVNQSAQEGRFVSRSTVDGEGQISRQSS